MLASDPNATPGTPTTESGWAPGVLPAAKPGRAGSRRAENRQRRTTSLCASALELFLARGINAVTIDDIASGANVAKGSFYRYYADKTQLVDGLLQPIAKALGTVFDDADHGMRSATDGDGVHGVIQTLVARVFDVAFQQPDVALLYLQERRLPSQGANGPVRQLSSTIDARLQALAAFANPVLSPPEVVEFGVRPRIAVGAMEEILFHALRTPTNSRELVVAEALAMLQRSALA